MLKAYGASTIREKVQAMGCETAHEQCVAYVYQHLYRLGIVAEFENAAAKRLMACNTASKLLNQQIGSLDDLKPEDMTLLAQMLSGRR